SAPVGSRVLGAVRQAADGSCTGPAVDLTAVSTYHLAINEFMAAGGDGYPPVVPRISNRDLLTDVTADHVTAHPPVSHTIQGGIACTTSGAVACTVETPLPGSAAVRDRERSRV